MYSVGCVSRNVESIIIAMSLLSSSFNNIFKNRNKMKKKILSVATACLFAAGLLLSFSENQHGQISLIGKTQAEVSPYLYQTYWAICPDGTTEIILCGQGYDTCMPSGMCPGM